MKRTLRSLILGGTLLLGNPNEQIKTESLEQSIERVKTELSTRGITNEQRGAYKPIVSDVIYRAITPYGYVPTARELWQGFKQNITNSDERVSNDFQLPREDAWRLYLGLPQKNNTFSISDYQPSKSREQKYYYKMDDFWEHYVDFLMVRNSLTKVEDAMKIMASIAKVKDAVEAERLVAGFDARHDELNWGMGVMGRFNLSAGEDEMGAYISYYDKWDLNTTLGKNSEIFGKPFEVYDRIHYDPETFKPKTDIKRNKRWNYLKNIYGLADSLTIVRSTQEKIK